MVYCASLQSRLALGYGCSGMHTCAGDIGTVPILLDESDKTPSWGSQFPTVGLSHVECSSNACVTIRFSISHPTPLYHRRHRRLCFPLRVSHLNAIKSWRDPLGLIPSSYNIKQRQTATYLSQSCDALCADDRRCASRSVRVTLHAGLHSAESMPCIAHGHLP
jgi:hypothetical protein